MSEQTRRRFAETMRSAEPDLGLACLLIGAEVDPELDVSSGQAALDSLARRATAEVPPGGPAYDVAAGLRAALGSREGFRGSGEDYVDVRSSLLHEVLRRRRGLPILLAVVYLEVARRLGAPLVGLGLPGHFYVGVPTADLPLILDPFDGGRLLDAVELEERVADATGTRIQLGAREMQPWPATDIVARVLNNVRVLAARSAAARTRLWAVELSLLLPDASASLRRERGRLRGRLGDFLGAAGDLEDYAAAVSALDPSSADDALREARMSRARMS